MDEWIDWLGSHFPMGFSQGGIGLTITSASWCKGGGGWVVHVIIWACSFSDTRTSSALHLLPLETWYPLFTPQLPTTTQFNSMSVMPSVIFCPPAFDVSLLANHWGIILFYFISLNFQIWFSGNIFQFLHNKSMASVSYHSTIKVSIH